VENLKFDVSKYNEIKIRHLIRAAQSAAHLPLKGKADKMSAENTIERGRPCRGAVSEAD